MISYIVAVSDKQILKKNLSSSIILYHTDEVVIIENPESIAKGYNEGILKAQNKIKCFIHQDVIILDPSELRKQLILNCVNNTGMVGVIGTLDESAIPWWDGYKHIGCVVDPNWGLYDFGRDGGICATLDGMMLATHQDIQFDEALPGFHMYDYDICRQMINRGLSNYCLPEGQKLIVHNAGYKRLDLSNDIIACKKKWGIK